MRIGSTDAPAIAGLSRWANERDAFNRIVLGMEAKQTKDMLRGKTVEFSPPWRGSGLVLAAGLTAMY